MRCSRQSSIGSAFRSVLPQPYRRLLRKTTGSMSSDRYDLVVGADGSTSTSREMTFGPQVRPRYTGQMNWRATVRRPPEVTGRYSFFGPTIKSGFNLISEREMYIYLLQNMPERPRWREGIAGNFARAVGRIRWHPRTCSRRGARPEANYLPPGLPHDHDAAMVQRTHCADR